MSASAPACTCASGSSWRGLEDEALLSAIARVFASLEPDGEPTPLINNTLRGRTRIPVKARAA
jgi:hypothetical protein